MYSDSPKAKRVEFRCPDPSANPYLAFAAMLMAGLDGIEQHIDPGAGAGPWLRARGDVFTRDVIDTWIDYKRKHEIDAVRLRPHPWEFHLYFDT